MTISQPPHTIAPLRERPAWKALENHAAKVRDLQLRQLFAEDPRRAEQFTLQALGLYFDYAKHRITSETIHLLLQLAEVIRVWIEPRLSDRGWSGDGGDHIADSH